MLPLSGSMIAKSGLSQLKAMPRSKSQNWEYTYGSGRARSLGIVKQPTTRPRFFFPVMSSHRRSKFANSRRMNVQSAPKTTVQQSKNIVAALLIRRESAHRPHQI